MINSLMANNNTFSHKVMPAVNNNVPMSNRGRESLNRTPQYILDSDARISMPRAIFGNEVMIKSRLAYRTANIHTLQDDHDDEDDEIFIANMMKRYNEHVKKNGGKMPVRAFPKIVKCVKKEKKNCLLSETNVNLMKRFRAEMAAAKANEQSSSPMAIINTSNINNHQESSKDDKISMKKEASTQTSFHRFSNVDNEGNLTNEIPAKKLINKVIMAKLDRRLAISTLPKYKMNYQNKCIGGDGTFISSMFVSNSKMNRQPLTSLLSRPICSSMYDPMTKSQRGSIAGCSTLPTLPILPSQFNNNIDDNINAASSQATTVSISVFANDPDFF